MKNRDLFTLVAGLRTVGDLCGAKFAYAVAKNLRLIQAEIVALQAGVKPEEAFIIYDEARLQLCIEHAERDEAGKPKINGTGYVIDAGKRMLFEECVQALQATHAEALDRHKEQLRGYSSLLDDEIAVELHLIDRNDLPEAITAAQLTAIFDVVMD